MRAWGCLRTDHLGGSSAPGCYLLCPRPCVCDVITETHIISFWGAQSPVLERTLLVDPQRHGRHAAPATAKPWALGVVVVVGQPWPSQKGNGLVSQITQRRC